MINHQWINHNSSAIKLYKIAVKEILGGEITVETIENFVGGEITVERIVDFVGDVKEDELNSFVESVTTMDEQTMIQIMTDLDGEVSYKKLEEKLGEDFTLEDIMQYIEGYTTTP